MIHIPAVVVNGKVVISGHVPHEKKLRKSPVRIHKTRCIIYFRTEMMEPPCLTEAPSFFYILYYFKLPVTMDPTLVFTGKPGRLHIGIRFSHQCHYNCCEE